MLRPTLLCLLVRPALLCLLVVAPAQADWEPRASDSEHRVLTHTLRLARGAHSPAERRGTLGRALEHPTALRDRLARAAPQGLDDLAWDALTLMTPEAQERFLLPVVKAYQLDTPQPVLERLGRLAARAAPRESSVSERTLLWLLRRAQEAPPGDWSDRLRLARALSYGGGERSVRALVQLLGQANPMTHDGQDVAAALAKLAETREETVCRTLVAQLRREEDPTRRYLGHTTLAAVASPRTRTYLQTSIRSGAMERNHQPDGPLLPDLAAAVDALARIDTPSAVNMLIQEEDWIQREDLPLRLALYRALAHAQRSAEHTDLIPSLVDWLGEAERDGEPKVLRQALVETLRTLTGKRISAHHASWARYLASR